MISNRRPFLTVKPIHDRIRIGKVSGTEIKPDGVEHLIVRDDEVLGIRI